MRRWQNWGKPQWKPQQQPASVQVKADLQDIINKHQAAALLEANENIRALKEQREAHMALVENQENTIQKLTAQVKQLQQQQQTQDNGDNDANSAPCTSTATSNQSHTDSSLQQEIQDLKRQLQERDELIEKLQQNQNSNNPDIKKSTHIIPTIEDNDQGETPTNENSTETIQKLQAKVKSLTDKTTKQEQEIEKLQNVLKELEDFYASNQSHDEEDEEHEEEKSPHGLEVVQEEGSFDASETSEHKEEHNLQHLDDKSLSESESTSAPQPTATMTLNGNQLVLLISSMPANRKVVQNQSRLETILQEYLNLSAPNSNEVQILDGCDRDPASVNLRNDLFRISGLHAVYPQLFLVNFATNDISFVGDFDVIMELHDTQTFADTIGLTPIS